MALIILTMQLHLYENCPDFIDNCITLLLQLPFGPKISNKLVPKLTLSDKN
jgi:hypothetical protein